MNNTNTNEKKKIYQAEKLLLFVMLIILCTACKRTEAEKIGNQEKLVVWAWDETFNIHAARVAAEMFKKSRPEVKVEVVSMTSEDIISKLDTGLVSGDYTGLPDIVLIEDYRIQRYLKEYREEFLPVSDIADADDFAPYKTSVNQVEGILYGIPFDSGVAAFFYRSDLIEEAGYAKEDMQNLTWERYIEIGQEVMEKTGKYMLTLNPNDLGEIRMMLQSAGRWYTDEEGNVDVRDNQALKDAITIYQQIFEAGISKQILDWDQFVGSLYDGEAVSVLTGCWVSSSIMEAADQKGKWAVAAFPRMEDNPDSVNASSIGGGAWYLLKCTGNEKLAKEFLQETFASDVELMNILAEEINLVSTLKEAKTAENYRKGVDFFGGQAIGSDFMIWQNQVPMVNYGKNTYEIEAILTEAIQLILEGQDMDMVLKEYHQKIEESLK